MIIDDAVTFLHAFTARNVELFGKTKLTVSEALDAAIFPDELGKLGGNESGLYIIWSKVDKHLIYVGISIDVVNRIYFHIGTGKCWARNGNIAVFPNCRLAGGRNWLPNETQGILRSAQWNITIIFPEPPKITRLLESALLHHCLHLGTLPDVNVEGTRDETAKLGTCPS